MQAQAGHTIEFTIGRNIKAAREAHGWKQSELAERTGSIARSTIAKIESGSSLTVSTLKTLADTLGVPPYMLLLRESDWKKLANVADGRKRIEKFQLSHKAPVTPDKAEAIQAMAASPRKVDRLTAVNETNDIVARIFGIEQLKGRHVDSDNAISMVSSTAMATAMAPTLPILNGIIANILAL